MRHGIDMHFAHHRALHEAYEHPAPSAPVLLTPDQVARRAKWLDSETRELRDATTIHNQADAFIDCIVFAIGGLVEMGVRPGPLVAIVDQANWAKVLPDGSVIKDADGKVQKPAGWIAPDADLKAEVERQIAIGGETLIPHAEPLGLTMREALIEARDQFMFYAAQHSAKARATVDNDMALVSARKAAANRALASVMHAAVNEAAECRALARALLCLSGFAGEGVTIEGTEDPADVYMESLAALGLDKEDDHDAALQAIVGEPKVVG